MSIFIRRQVLIFLPIVDLKSQFFSRRSHKADHRSTDVMQFKAFFYIVYVNMGLKTRRVIVRKNMGLLGPSLHIETVTFIRFFL